MPVKAIFLLPTFILIAAGIAIYDNREQVLRLIDTSRRRIAVKLREIADDLQPQSEDVEIDELLRESRERRERRGSSASHASRRSRRSAKAEAEGTAVEVREMEGLRKRTAGPSSSENTASTAPISTPTPAADETMKSSFVSAVSHTSRESTATLSPAPAPVQEASLAAPPLTTRSHSVSPHHEPSNPFESGYDTQHSESAFEGAAYWDVNEWVATTPHSRAASNDGGDDNHVAENSSRRGDLTPNTETASVVSTPSMAGSDVSDDEVRSLPDEGDAWSEVGSDISERSEEGRR